MSNQGILQLPTCAQSCISTAVSSAGCSAADLRCICLNNGVSTVAAPCLLSACSASDIAKTQELFAALCAANGYPNGASLSPSSSSLSASPSTTTVQNPGGPATSRSTTTSSSSSTSTGISSTGTSQTTTSATAGANSSTSGAVPSGTPTPTPDSPNNAGGGITGGAIAGIVIGAILGLALLAFLIWFILRRKRRAAAKTPAPALMPELQGKEYTGGELDGANAGPGGAVKPVTAWDPHTGAELDVVRAESYPAELTEQTRAYEMHHGALERPVPELAAYAYNSSGSPDPQPLATHEVGTYPASSMPPPWASDTMVPSWSVPQGQGVQAAQQGQDQSYAPSSSPSGIPLPASPPPGSLGQAQQAWSPPVGESADQGPDISFMEAEAAELEARRQRLLEIERVEGEQRQLRARIAAARAGQPGGGGYR